MESSLFESVVAFFEEDDWHPLLIEGETTLVVRFQGDHGEFHGQASAHEEDALFIFHSVLDDACPDERRATMMEYLTRANLALYLGNFEFDLDSGHIRFKTSVDVEDAQLTAALVRNIVYTGCMTMDRHLPGITAVINTGISALDALDIVE